ncbi:HalOD1 output domain-containing protein [Halostagnicola bangensis]
MSPFESASTPSQPVSQRVVQAVAEKKGIDPLELDPIFNAVDPESLDTLFEPTKSGRPRAVGSVTFSYAECMVTIDADGSIDIARDALAQSSPQAEPTSVD